VSQALPLEHTKLRSGNWSNSLGKRIFDFASAALALVLLSPLMILVAVLVKMSSKGPVLFRQTRMGKGGHSFQILKFRSMRVSESGPAVTKVGDSRLTPIGGFLRKAKLDELPQLINVLKGEMSLVGPRPKLLHHQTYTLRVRPGVTGAASLAFRNEEDYLSQVPDHALDACQINVLVPLKRELDDRYMAEATFLSDLGLMLRTVLGSKHEADRERLGNLQVSLVTLSQALGQSVAPAAQPVHDGIFVNRMTVR
jgi:lipopolysaccharide/colanic/teichoic acid biosynthesis glycosyltransferase